VYETLFREMPDQPSGVLVLPHFAPMGPPDYIADSSGVILGLTTETDRGAILRGIAEGNVFAHRLVVDRLPEVDIDISVLRAVGGGSRSEKTLALTADILNRPILRPKVEEAGALGAALLAGTGIRTYSSLGEAVSTAVRVEKTVEPNARNVERYNDIFELYKELRESILPLTQKWTRIRDSF
jgi:xylulokinase